MSRMYTVIPFIYIIYRVHRVKCRAGWSTSWNQDCNNLRYADDATLMAESEELKSLLMKVKEESEKAGLKLNTEKAMAPHSSTLSWKIPWMEEPGGLQSIGSLSQTRMSDFTFTFHFHALEKEMATHSSVLDWRIPGTGEPGGLPSMGSHRVGHDWSDLAAAKLNIQKTKIMASGPITSWQIDGETMETVRLYFAGLQNHCRWWL